MLIKVKSPMAPWRIWLVWATIAGGVLSFALILCVSNRAMPAGDGAKPGEARLIDEPAPANSSLAGFLPSDRATLWNPGLRGVGGIPERETICATLSPLGGGADDTARVQTAINRCPAGQVVQLEAGVFSIKGQNSVLLSKGITLRGAGAGRTTLEKPDGAKPFPQRPGDSNAPLIVVGPSRFVSVGASTNLMKDAVKGAYTITVESTAGLFPGQIVLLDEASGAGWQPDPIGSGLIWASPDLRVIWKKHKPPIQNVDDFKPDVYPDTSGSAGGWFSRLDRPTCEVKQIASVSGFNITFTTPVHISYRISHFAQLSRYDAPHVMKAGVEDLTLVGGTGGNLIFAWAALSWARNVESTKSIGDAFSFISSFRIELREFYAHDAAWAQPGGGGYLISLSCGTAEALIENGISVRANKVIVARSAGAGSVVGYNYMDMSYINYNGAWIETGINASHMVGSHHVLFEGNFSHNAESDNTHGNSIYITFFRNYLRGIRAPFDNQAGGKIDDAKQSGNAPKHAAGLTAYSYWMSFVGNVLGVPGQMADWVYETRFGGGPGIWMLGWDQKTDANVAATAIRHGNYDYLTNSVKWDPSIPAQALPNSLYLTKRPAFFDAGRGYSWPWVVPLDETKVHVLPAKARYDAGTPFTQP